jgi:outer membrane protein assembly factor BamB
MILPGRVRHLAGADSACWTGFHNGGANRSESQNLPVEWSPEKGVAWFADLPGYGQSAPVIWKETVFITSVSGPNKEANQATAYDVRTGKPRWRRAFASRMPVQYTYTVSRAAPTPAVDANALYLFFESGDLIALTHEGKTLWERSLSREYGKFINRHGIGGSPAQTADSLILLIEDAPTSYLLCIDKRTGKNRWKVDREPRTSWTSPMIARRKGRDEIIISSNGVAQGYATDTGAKLWEMTGLTGNNIPSPAVDGDRVFIGASPSARQAGGVSAAESNCCLRLVEKDGKPSYEPLWRARKAVCTFMSPLVYQGHVYYVNGAGVLYCLDAETGEERYAERIDGACWAQPIGAGDRIYFFGKNGITTVVRAGPRFEKIASNRLWPADEPPLPKSAPPAANIQNAGPPSDDYLDPILYGAAAAGDALFVRVGTRLYCLRKS